MSCTDWGSVGIKNYKQLVHHNNDIAFLLLVLGILLLCCKNVGLGPDVKETGSGMGSVPDLVVGPCAHFFLFI